MAGGRGAAPRAFSALDDAALAAVLNWMIPEFGPEPGARGFRAYTAGEVAGYRADPLVDVETERERLLRRIEALGARRR